MISQLKQAYATIFLGTRFFIGIALLVLFFTLAFVFPWMMMLSEILAAAFVLTFLVEFSFLFGNGTVQAKRQIREKLSNGDINPVDIHLESSFSIALTIELYDELPIEWQVRDFKHSLRLKKQGSESIPYTYRPTRRGAYEYGHVIVLASFGLQLLKRRFKTGLPQEIAVYPSYMTMAKYEYLAISNTLTSTGIKKIRRIGQQSEFEKIKEYVAGDDFRSINWRATARREKLMSNVYQDERSQQVYCLLDKGRVMNQPFEEMTLLDHAINASLVLSNIAIKKYDKAGIISFDEDQAQMLPASKKAGQMLQIQELLYRQETRFLESDYERLYLQLKKFVPQRSLLVLFTNFDTVSSMQRRLPYLRAMSKNHLLLVVFFENTETLNLIHKKAHNLQDVYRKMVAEKMRFEKEQIVSELRKNGIISLLTSPKDLTLNTINRYLELKARGLI